MSKLCTGCGRELAEGAAFCTECGTPVPAEIPQLQTVGAPAPEPQYVPPQPQPASAPQQQYAPPPQPQPMSTGTPQYAVQPKPVSTEQSQVVSTGGFFGLMFLFALPLVGWIICIVMAFSSKNENKKHFAKAMIIWMIIGLVLSLIIGALIAAAGSAASVFMNEAVGGGEFGEFMEALKQLEQYK